MADTSEVDSRPAPTTRARPDADSLRAGLARMRAGDASEAVTPSLRNDEDANVDDTNDHGDEPEVEARPAKAKAKPAKKAAEPEPEPDDEPELDADEEEPDLEEPEEEPEIEADAPDEEPAVEPDEEPEAPKVDPELERRAARLRKQEQRMRDRVRTERDQVARERETLKTERAELDEYKRLKARAKYDPTGVLRHLGLTDDDLEPAAKHIYAQTKEAAKDPKNRDAADRLMRERELLSTIESLKSRLDKQDEERQTTARAEQERTEAIRYLTGVRKVAKPGTLAAHYLGKGGGAAERAMQTFAAITAELAEDDELPEPGEVLAEYETRRRAELEDDGVDVDALLRRKAAPAAAAAAKNGKKPVAAPAKNGAVKPAPRAAAPAKREPGPPAFVDPELRKDEVFRDLQALRAKKRIN
ncbi:MAG TPA: hypothetical protein VJU58_04115 [Microbacterium sp.]|nr:hypothetical protein [Microbacterium sp.]